MSEINRPFTAIMGGSKVSSKIEIIENLLGKVDNPDYNRWYDFYIPARHWVAISVVQFVEDDKA